MSKAELLAFDINKVISTDVDKISAGGRDMSIPSNISLPKQTERYLFFSITLDKNPFRIYFDSPGPQKIVALKGRFPFKKVVDELRSEKNFIDLINQFTIDGGTLQNIHIN